MPTDLPQTMPPQAQEKVLEIRDIHLPDPVSWWPPALGWWLVLLVVIIVLVLLRWFWLRRLKHRASAKFLAQQELADLEQTFHTLADRHQLVQGLSALLRRSCVSLFPHEKCAGLTGDAWLKFLDDHSTGKGFSTALGRQLINANYSGKISSAECRGDDLIALCKNWLEGLP